jgi:hypothetical protein
MPERRFDTASDAGGRQYREPRRRKKRRSRQAAAPEKPSPFSPGGPLESPGSRIARKTQSEGRREREEATSRRAREGSARPRPARRLMSLKEQIARGRRGGRLGDLTRWHRRLAQSDPVGEVIGYDLSAQLAEHGFLPYEGKDYVPWKAVGQSFVLAEGMKGRVQNRLVADLVRRFGYRPPEWMLSNHGLLIRLLRQRGLLPDWYGQGNERDLSDIVEALRYRAPPSGLR